MRVVSDDGFLSLWDKEKKGEGRDDVRCSDGEVRDRVVGLVNKRGVDAVVVVMTAMGEKMEVKTREVSRA